MKEAIDEFLSFLKEDNSYDRKRYHRTHISSNDSCGSRDHNDNETDSSLQTVKEFLKTAKPRLHESCDAHGGCGMWYDDKEKQVEEPHSCCEGMPIC